MSTDTDGAPPSVRRAPDVEPEPPEQRSGPEQASAGSGWLQEEIRRRMAERGSSGGGRHARRDGAAEPPRGVEHVPRHSVAPAPGPRPTAIPTPTAPPVAEAVPPARVTPTPGPVGGPSLPPTGALVRRRSAPADGGWSGPELAGPPAPADAPATGPSPRRVPTAYKPGARGVVSGAQATFGGPEFDAPATRADVAAAQEPLPAADAPVGGPHLAGPAPRDLPPSPEQIAPAAEAPTGAPERPQAPGGTDIRPPARPARLLAGPAPTGPPPGPTPVGPLPAAPGRRPSPADLSAADRLDLTGPVQPVGGGAVDTVLWSATMPPPVDGETTTATPAVPVDLPSPRAAEPASSRVKIVFSERRGGAHPVRTVVDIQEGGAVGELLRSDLIGSQLTVALRFALLAGLTLGLLPLAFALFPAIGRIELLGFRLPWLLLGFVVYPVLWGLGWWHTRVAERVEQNFADHVQE